MSIMIFKGYVHDVETKNINGSPMFEATVKHRMGYGDNAVTIFTRVAFWGQLGSIAQEKIFKDSRVQITSEIKGGRPYITKKGEPSFGMNCKGLSFDVLASSQPSEQRGGQWGDTQNKGSGWGGNKSNAPTGNSGWGGGGYEGGDQNRGGGWRKEDDNDPVPF